MAELDASATRSQATKGIPADLKSRLKASYDAIAPKYNEWTTSHSVTRLHYLDQLLDRLQTAGSSSPVSVLELGCGAGVPVTQKLLSYPNYTVTGNDLSGGQLALARASLLSDPSAPSNDRLTLLEGDMLVLDFPEASFDAVIALYSIIHLPRNEQVEMLAKLVTWLKPGGWFLANFGAQELPGAEAQHWLGEEKGWMYWSGFGKEGTLEKLKEAGLQVDVQETVDDEEDATFLWILAKKSGS